MKDDLISRQAAIEELQNHYEVRNPKQNAIMDECVMLISNVPSAQPEQIARDIATIIENEQDMRVILQNAEHTETHSCENQHTVTHDWIPVTEALPEYGTEVVTVNKDDEYEINHVIDEEDREWFYDGVVAWMPLPEPWRGGQDEQAN